MDDRTHSPTRRLKRSIETGEYDDAVACLREFDSSAADRKAALRAVRDLADEQSVSVEPLLPELTAHLTDEERSVRLTAAKLFVAVAREEPSAAAEYVDALGARLADEAEFYYVRARSAEALGYVALEQPAEVASPELLADLRIGLSFDEPEVKEKLAKALASVAMGDPGRLRHHAGDLADHLDDDADLVRYHLCTTLAAIGCQYPGALSDASPAITERLADENPYVRGRAAEALGLLARAEPDEIERSADGIPTDDGAEPFVSDRLRFARAAIAGDALSPDGIGSVDAIREAADETEAAAEAPDPEHTCPHCGLSLPEQGPPACPVCGAPRRP
jgi:HEAT repeat protein